MKRASTQGMSGFVHGLGAPWRGLSLILEEPQLWPLAIGPALVTNGMFLAAVFAGYSLAQPVAFELFPDLVHWPLLFAIGVGAVGLVLIIGFVAISLMLAALVCIPIHDALSARVESLHDALPPPLSFREALPISLAHSVLGFGLWMLLQIVLLPLQLVPVVGSLLDLVLGFTLTAFFLSHQLLDGPMSRRQMSFGAKMGWLTQRLPMILGMGSMTALVCAIPVVNTVAMPVAIAGGALFFLQENGEGV